VSTEILYRVAVAQPATPSKADRPQGRRWEKGAVRDGLIAAGLELARNGGPDAVVLREATRIVGVVPNAAYRHFADHDALLTAVCAAAMQELAGRMAKRVASVRGRYADPAAARRRLSAVGASYLEFARDAPGLFATAFSVPQHHDYDAPDDDAGPYPAPLSQLRTVLDELVAAHVLDPDRRVGIEYPIWSTVHGLAVLTGQGPLRAVSPTTRRQLEALASTFIGYALSAPTPSPSSPTGAEI
jgi:AcrR family transcriptional regulator